MRTEQHKTAVYHCNVNTRLEFRLTEIAQTHMTKTSLGALNFCKKWNSLFFYIKLNKSTLIFESAVKVTLTCVFNATFIGIKSNIFHAVQMIYDCSDCISESWERKNKVKTRPENEMDWTKQILPLGWKRNGEWTQKEIKIEMRLKRLNEEWSGFPQLTPFEGIAFQKSCALVHVMCAPDCTFQPALTSQLSSFTYSTINIIHSPLPTTCIQFTCTLSILQCEILLRTTCYRSAVFIHPLYSN